MATLRGEVIDRHPLIRSAALISLFWSLALGGCARDAWVPGEALEPRTAAAMIETATTCERVVDLTLGGLQHVLDEVAKLSVEEIQNADWTQQEPSFLVEMETLLQPALERHAHDACSQEQARQLVAEGLGRLHAPEDTLAWHTLLNLRALVTEALEQPT